MDESPRRSLIYETVLEHVKAQLLAGRLRPGDRLPTVTALAGTMGVSAAAVREAYRVLESMGLLDVTQGRGTFVAALPADGPSILGHFQLSDSQSLAHLFEVRLLLEPQIAALAAGRASSSERAAILATAREQERLQREGLDFVEPDIRFHELLVVAAHNPVLARMTSAVNELLLDSRRRTVAIRGAAEKAASYHVLVALAVGNRDAEQARAVMEQHIRDVARDAGAAPAGAPGVSGSSGARSSRRLPG
jgi:GntR family transcriptional regulator, transcriptional repressor for pyruvate dehydrogenase complex